MRRFANTFITAMLAGFIGGILLTGIQSLRVLPLIHEAENYEGQAIINYATGQAVEMETTVAIGSHMESGHEDLGSKDVWSPASGAQRLVLTGVANVCISVAFSFILLALFNLIEGLSILRGIAFGFMGYVIFFLVPSIGLAPELPGATAAGVFYRQIWWLMTVLCTGAAFALIYFRNNPIERVYSLVLVALPHIFGAPQPAIHGGSAPKQLAADFVIATHITNSVFWLILGGLTAALLLYLERRQQALSE